MFIYLTFRADSALCHRGDVNNMLHSVHYELSSCCSLRTEGDVHFIHKWKCFSCIWNILCQLSLRVHDRTTENLLYICSDWLEVGLSHVSPTTAYCSQVPDLLQVFSESWRCLFVPEVHRRSLVGGDRLWFMLKIILMHKSGHFSWLLCRNWVTQYTAEMCLAIPHPWCCWIFSHL